MGVISWLIFGLIAGIIAKLLMKGNDPQGCLVTIAIGIAGGAIGGWIGTQLGLGSISGFDIRSLGLAVVGSIVLLLILRAVQGRMT
ncbi:MAG: GlsB/YeaQ/YmgE family stress response membrane protein [Pirellulaceae bacterium]|nr:GlsB/YeaQ/YmgE family stress response membrane protein [Pirellulaceae bacterium]